MIQIHVVPQPGLRVIDPETRKPLPPEGKLVDYTSYWVSRLKDLDCFVFEPKDQPERPAKDKAK